eukprot:403366634
MKTIDIEITIYNCLDAQLIPPVQGNKVYNISDPTEIIPLSTFTITPNYDCGQYQYYPALILPGPIEIALPTFIQFDSINNNLEVQTGDVLKIGSYTIRIYGNATDYSIINYYELTIDIKCMTITYTAFESGKSSLPSFMTFNALQRKFQVFSNDNSFAKKYDLVIKQLVNKFSTYNLPSVTDPDGDKFLISVQLGQQSIWIAYSQPTFKISPGLSNNGTYSIKVLITDTNKNPNEFYLFSKHQRYLTIEFTTEILVPANISTIDNNVLRLKINPSSLSQITDLTFKWEIRSFESRQMVLYLNFTNPDLISTKGTDILQLIFMQNGRFIEQSSNKPIASEFTLIIRIPKQQEPSDANAALKSALNSASTSMKTIMVGNLALNIVMQTIQCHLFLQVGFTVIFVGNDQCHLDNFSFTIIQYKLP